MERSVLDPPPATQTLAKPREGVFAKLKGHVRAMAMRSIDQLWKAIGQICDLFAPQECANYFKAAAYGFTCNGEAFAGKTFNVVRLPLATERLIVFTPVHDPPVAAFANDRFFVMCCHTAPCFPPSVARDVGRGRRASGRSAAQRDARERERKPSGGDQRSGRTALPDTSLADLGVTKNQSRRCQKLGALAYSPPSLASAVRRMTSL